MSNSSKPGQASTVNEAEITLGVLNAVEQSSSVTQRSVASDLDIALGLANAYLKRCAIKGFIKILQVPRNRYAYYLTPQGFAEKSRLAGEYLSQSFNFFRAARSQCTEIFDQCAAQGLRRVVLAGISDLAEVTTLCARDRGVELIGILDMGETGHKEFAGLPVRQTLDELGPMDVILITDMTAPQETFDILATQVDVGHILAPQFLHVSKSRPEMMEG